MILISSAALRTSEAFYGEEMKDKIGGTCKKIREMPTKLSSENLKGTDRLGDQGIDGRKILKRIL
jgi:hypothetical protein